MIPKAIVCSVELYSEMEPIIWGDSIPGFPYYAGMKMETSRCLLGWTYIRQLNTFSQNEEINRYN